MSFNPLIKALHTDLYQLTMAYSRFMEGKRNDHASFEVFFRKGPFDGEFAVFAGADEVYHFVKNFKFDETDIDCINKYKAQGEGKLSEPKVKEFLDFNISKYITKEEIIDIKREIEICNKSREGKKTRGKKKGGSRTPHRFTRRKSRK